jgi:hypothetical protein
MRCGEEGKLLARAGGVLITLGGADEREKPDTLR